jgi:hypothetical protein
MATKKESLDMLIKTNSLKPRREPPSPQQEPGNGPDEHLIDIRRRAQDAVRNLEAQYWQLGRELELIKRERLYTLWGFPDMRTYVERELAMPNAKAKRILRVVTTFTAHQEQITSAELGWSVLSEALPIARAEGAGMAIVVAREGREAVRSWKKTHYAADGEEDQWKAYRIRLPLDVYEQLQDMVELVGEVARHNGASIDREHPHQALAAILAEAEPGLRAQLPEPEGYAGVPCPASRASA